jgi:hypothetical protein
MLKKCLKYDLKAVFRLWWIPALTMLALSLPCGFCLNRLILKPDPNSAYILEAMVVFLSAAAAVVFGVMSLVLCVVRYYGNFFRDEGYLTFTLPVKRQTLFASKVLSIAVVTLSTAAVTALCLCIVTAMAPATNYDGEVVKQGFSILQASVVDFLEFCREMIGVLGGWFWVYAVEFVALALGTMLVHSLLVCFSITMGATVVRKMRWLAAVGIYYVSNMVFSMVQSLGLVAMGMFVVSGFASNPAFLRIDDAAQLLEGILPLAALLLVIWILFLLIASTVLYFATLGTLERKLNLQ